MSGVYGGTSTLSATLKSASGAAITNRTVSFQLDGSPAGTATTNASGVATLTGVSLGRTPVGTYANRVAAAFAGDTHVRPGERHLGPHGDEGSADGRRRRQVQDLR